MLEEVVGLGDARERVAVGDERGGVDASLLNEAEDLGAVAAVDATGFEGEIFAVHVGEGEYLRLVVHGHDGDYGVGAGHLPCRAECVRGTCHLDDAVGAAMVGEAVDYRPAFGRGDDMHARIVIGYKLAAEMVGLADYDLFGIFQQYACQGAESGGPGAKDEHSVVGGDFRDAGSPESGGEDVADEERLLIGD